MDLDKIIDKTCESVGFDNKIMSDTYRKWQVEMCMKEAIRQALELACERVYCNDEEDLSKSIMSIMDEL